MWPIIEYLKGPELVVQFQEFFGVRYINNKTSITSDDEGLSSDATRPLRSNDEDSTGSDLQSKNNTSYGLHKRNVSSGSSETDEGFNEPRNEHQTELYQHSAQSEIRPYEITNKFWYYLFVIGTEFGDEIFYATMIPFWFWNVDGAVGRRVVFVWAVVMYIGKSCLFVLVFYGY